MLELQHITYSIAGKILVNDISLHVRPGELLMILGANGAGKTTLLKMLGSELRPSAGSIYYNEIPLEKYTVQELSRKRSVLSQQHALELNFPVKEVVMMGRYPYFSYQPSGKDHEIVTEAMRLTEVSHLAEKPYPVLSGGEKQRVHIARSIAQAKQIPGENTGGLILWDEPLNNLDIRYQHQCMEWARQLANENHIVVMIIHDINFAAAYADKMLMMKSGKALCIGRSEEVFTKEFISDCYDFPVQLIPQENHSIPLAYFSNRNLQEHV